VKEETDTHVFLQTPVGDMGVPRTEISRIQRTRTIQDTYKEQLASIREGDVNGLFKLALWCRSANGLRKESDELLAQVISLKKDHAEARRMLGHVKLGSEWKAPSPLSIQLKVSGANASELRQCLDLFLKTRQDVRLAPESKSKPDAGDPLGSCTLQASVSIVRKAPTRFYGQPLGKPTVGATVRLQAQSSWVGKTALKTTADGQLPEDASGASVAIQNAFGTSSTSLHKFLDQLTALRSKKIEEEFQKKPLAKARKTTAPNG
jgi:hypothetical protein